MIGIAKWRYARSNSDVIMFDVDITRCVALYLPNIYFLKIVCEYDKEIPQSQTTDNLMAPRGRATYHHETPGRQIKKSNQLSLLHQDDCNTRMDIKQRTTKHSTITNSHNGSNNKQKSQQQQNHRLRTDSSLCHQGGGD